MGVPLRMVIEAMNLMLVVLLLAGFGCHSILLRFQFHGMKIKVENLCVTELCGMNNGVQCCLIKEDAANVLNILLRSEWQLKNVLLHFVAYAKI